MEDPEMNIKMHQMINALAWKDDFDGNIVIFY